MDAPLLQVDNLRTWFDTLTGTVRSVDGLSFNVRAGQTLGIVGESGSGKTTLGLALLRLVSSDGPIVYRGRRIDGLNSKEMRPLRMSSMISLMSPRSSPSPL